MDDVEILILARLRGQLAVINRHDDARPLDCRSAGAQPQILHRPDLRQIPGAVLQLIDFFLQCIAFLFRLQETGRQLLDTLVGQRGLLIERRPELQGEHEAQHHADEGNRYMSLFE